MEKEITKKCLNCEKEFTTPRAWKKYCNRQCAIQHWQRTHEIIAFENKEKKQEYENEVLQKQLSYLESQNSRLIHAKELSDLCKPFIYKWIRSGDILYIGSTTKGIKRILTHNIVGVVDDIHDTDVFEIIPCETEQLLEKERALIDIHKPMYNDKGLGSSKQDRWRVCRMCKKSFITTTDSQWLCSIACFDKLKDKLMAQKVTIPDEVKVRALGHLAIH